MFTGVPACHAETTLFSKMLNFKKWISTFCFTGLWGVVSLNVHLNQYQRRRGERSIYHVNPSIIWKSWYLIQVELLLIGQSFEVAVPQFGKLSNLYWDQKVCPRCLSLCCIRSLEFSFVRLVFHLLKASKIATSIG